MAWHNYYILQINNSGRVFNTYVKKFQNQKIAEEWCEENSCKGEYIFIIKEYF